MSASGEAPSEKADRLHRQIPFFAAIGLFGYCVDAGITYLGAKYLALPPEIARLPAFVIATIVNFTLNRAITFAHIDTPLMAAFFRYCLVASAGLVVNYAVYSLCLVLSPMVGVAVTPGLLPLFVAAGSGVAMVVTFVGFRWFAFRR